MHENNYSYFYLHNIHFKCHKLDNRKIIYQEKGISKNIFLGKHLLSQENIMIYHTNKR